MPYLHTYNPQVILSGKNQGLGSVPQKKENEVTSQKSLNLIERIVCV